MSRIKTSNDLIVRVLANLGVLIAGQAPDPEDVAYVSEEIDSILRKLAGLNICWIPNKDEIPEEWFQDLAAIVAGELAAKMGVSADRYVLLKLEGLGGVQGVEVGGGAAAKSLREINRNRPTRETLQTWYL